MSDLTRPMLSLSGKSSHVGLFWLASLTNPPHSAPPIYKACVNINVEKRK